MKSYISVDIHQDVLPLLMPILNKIFNIFNFKEK